mgnify:CR=1 FL=1
MYWIIFIGFALLSWLVSHRLKSKFEAYSKVALPNGMTGKDVAEKMLRDNGIYDVKVISTPGHLTDHYNPGNHTVNLSENVYYSTEFPAIAAVRNHLVCCHYAFQLYNITGRDKRKQQGFSLVKQRRYNQCGYPR